MFGAILVIAGLYLIYKALRYDAYRGGGSVGRRWLRFKARMVSRLRLKLNLDATQTQKLDLAADQFMAYKQLKNDQLRGVTHGVNPWHAVLRNASFDRVLALDLIGTRTTALQRNGEALMVSVADFYDSLQLEQQEKLRHKIQHFGHWGRGRGC